MCIYVEVCTLDDQVSYICVQFALCMYVPTCVCDNLVNFIHRFYYDVILILNQHLVCLNIIVLKMHYNVWTFIHHKSFLLVCAWEDQRENQYYICHKISSVLYGKYSTVISKYSTVILIYHVVNNPP